MNHLSKLGFKTKGNSPHTARTIMLDELETLIEYVNDVNASKEDYIKAIEIDNCLNKRSVRNRKISARHLVDLYLLDNNVLLFKALLVFWKRDKNSHSLLALLCSYARDPLLKISSEFILMLSAGNTVSRDSLKDFLEKKEPGRFSDSTILSTTQNILSSWVKSGHLKGRVKKYRAKAIATEASVSYSLLLGYLEGNRGKFLFETGYSKLLDCSVEKAIELAEEASRKGWINFKRIGNVIEVTFPELITVNEMEIING